MSLYAVTMARFGHRSCFSTSLSAGVDAANPCARLPQDNRERGLSDAVSAFIRARYSDRSLRLRSRTRSVTWLTIGFSRVVDAGMKKFPLSKRNAADTVRAYKELCGGLIAWRHSSPQ